MTACACFGSLSLGVGGCERASLQIFEKETEISLENCISQLEQESQLKLIHIHQAHLGPIPTPFKWKHTLSFPWACLTSSKPGPHRARWVTWNKMHISCKNETKGSSRGCWEHSMSPVSAGMCHEPLERVDSQEAGVPQLTENIHPEGPLAGPCLELRELWRMTQTHPSHRRTITNMVGGKQTALDSNYIPWPPTIPYSTLQTML